VQKRPSTPRALRRLARDLSPVRLPDRFPFSAGDHLHPDAPFTHLHLHDALELGWCTRGAGTFVVEDKVMRFAAGTAVVINDREFHIARSDPGTTSDWTFCYLDPLRLVGAQGDASLLDHARLCGPDFRNLLQSDRDPVACALVRDLVEEWRRQRSGWQDAVRALVWRLMIELRRSAPTPVPAEARPQALSRLQPALQAMREAPERDHAMAALAARCDLSETHFRRLFAAGLGQPPLQWLLRLRISRAQWRLRRTPDPVARIALDCGFASLSSFNRHFRRLVGSEPRSWRRG
jgi:AraC-like DNA-binding protein